jgi:hypothetical protein
VTARWLVNLGLLIVVAVLGAAAYRELGPGAGPLPLTALDPAQIAAVAIERPGEPAIRLARTPDGWRMEAPYQVAADQARIAKLLQVAAAPVRRSLPPGARPDRLGLDPARVRLALDGTPLRFGDTEPIGHWRYVAVGERIELIDDRFQHRLSAPATDYVSRRLLPPGFQADTAALDSRPLPSDALAELAGLEAARVVPAGERLSGRILTLGETDSGRLIRFLVSADGRRWTRVDLRLTYLLAQAPAALGKVGQAPAEPPAAPDGKSS